MRRLTLALTGAAALVVSMGTVSAQAATPAAGATGEPSPREPDSELAKILRLPAKRKRAG